MDSGASLHMMSDNEFFSGEKGTIPRPKEPTVITTANGKEESAEEATVYVDDLDVLSQWCCCEIHQQCYLWVFYAKKWATRTNGNLEGLHQWWKMDIWQGARLRTTFQLWPFQKERRTSDNHSKPIASSRRQRIRRQVAIRFQSGFQPFEQASLAIVPTRTQSWWNNL